MITHERATWNNGHHPPRHSSTRDDMGIVRDAYQVVIDTLYETCPESRELAVAVTELESSRMWAIMSLAVNEEEISG